MKQDPQDTKLAFNPPGQVSLDVETVDNGYLVTVMSMGISKEPVSKHIAKNRVELLKLLEALIK